MGQAAGAVYLSPALVLLLQRMDERS